MPSFISALLVIEITAASKITLDDDKPLPLSELSCFDRELNCDRKICRQHPEVGKEKCAKTCGFCDQDGGRERGGAHSPNLCFDRKMDCTNDFCRDHSQLAKEQCARTCGFCTPTLNGSSRASGQHQSKTTPRPSGRGFGSLDSICFDRDLMCTQEICRDYRDIAREKCAKTCGYC